MSGFQHGVLIKRIRDRVGKYNKNFICCFVGDTGSGKSYAALRLAEKVSDNFKILPSLKDYDNVVFGDMANQFMRILNRKGEGELGPGDVILWDEAGLGMPKKEWYDVVNRMINKVVQSFRWKRLILILTVPDSSFIDSDTRKLFHMIFEMVGIDFKKKLSVAKPKEVQVNHISNKSYYWYPRLKDSDGRIAPMTRISFSMPSKELIDIYEKKREKWSREFNKRAEETISASMRKKEQKNIDFGHISEEILEKYKDYLSVPSKKSDRTHIVDGVIMAKHNVNANLAARIKRNVELQLRKSGKIK